MLPEIVQLAPDFWQVYRDLRLEALVTDPHAFAVTHQEELATTEAQWRAFIGNMWFAQIDEEVVGMIGLLHNPTLPCKHRASVISFWVKPSYRGQGIGAALVRHMQDVARSRGYRKLDLNVAITQDTAIALYEKVGVSAGWHIA
jgi:ribosomal protein S18 acetylase RimI-like enzyme